MRDWNEVNELCMLAHVPGLHRQEGSVLILFDDGELCFTKCGSLLYMRSLHQFETAILRDDDKDRPSGFVAECYGNKCIFVSSQEDADVIREVMTRVKLADSLGVQPDALRKR